MIVDIALGILLAGLLSALVPLIVILAFLALISPLLALDWISNKFRS